MNLSKLSRSTKLVLLNYQGRNLSVRSAPLALSFQRNAAAFDITRRTFAVTTEPLESLGDSITTAVLLNWSKEPGQWVKEDEVIAVVETDKVTMDIRAKKAGKFIEGLAAPQSEVSVGSPLYKIDCDSVQSVAASAPSTTSELATPSPTIAATPTTQTSQKVIVNVPIMGESITTGVLAKWLCKAGDEVSVDQVVASIETDKVTVDVRSPHEGVVTQLLAEEGKEVQVDQALLEVQPQKRSAAVAASVPSAQVASAVKEPVKAATNVSAKPAASVAKAPVVPNTTAPKKVSEGNRSETRVKMTRMRLRIAQRLKDSQNTAAMLTTFQEVDMSALMELRGRYKDDFEKVHGVKLGFMSAFVRACTATLQEIPAVNAVIDDSTGEIVYRNYVDVSVAVASPSGLVVPVLRNTESMSFADVEKAIGAFGKKAKEGGLALEDMAGGTFTISNGGVFGSLFGTPIINPPQSAILGMHATKMRPVVVNGKVEARPMMYLALTYDHRMIDGREAVTFLKSVAAKIEDPGRLLLSV